MIGNKMTGNIFLSKRNSFEIANPQISISKSMSHNFAQLKYYNIEFTIVAKGYIVFRACVFSADEEICIGLHFKKNRLYFIELFRTREYFHDNYNIDLSYADFNNKLEIRYGIPKLNRTIPTIECANSHSSWSFRGMRIEHWIIDRFGPEERLSITFEN
jgi:hypothetical protein